MVRSPRYIPCFLGRWVQALPRFFRSRTAESKPHPDASVSFRELGSRARWLVVILVAISCLRLLTLGSYPLTDTTEGRYSDIPREMLALNTWIVPHLDPGLPFWGKPPLSFWATAVSFSLLGFSEFAARFPGFLFSTGALVLMIWLARDAFGWIAALRAGIILSTCGLFFVMSGGVLTDPSLFFCVTLTMVAFAHAAVLRKPSRVWGYLFFAGLGLGILAKGLVGIVLPAVAIGLWLLIYGGWANLRRLPWIGGSLLFLAIAVPWHILAEIHSPGFLEYYVIGEHFLRFVDRGWEGDLYGNPHEELKGMSWYFGLISTMPWSLIAVFAIFAQRKALSRIKDPLLGLVFLWLLAPVLFFTPSDNVMITYVLPGLPAFAICCERLIYRACDLRVGHRSKEGRTRKVFSTPAIAIMGALISILANAGMLFIMRPEAEERSQKRIVELYEDLRDSYAVELVYYNEMQYSGDFYSGGAAIVVDDDDIYSLSRELLDHERDFYVIDDDDLEEFRLSAKDVHHLGTFGEYTLFVDSGLVL